MNNTYYVLSEHYQNNKNKKICKKSQKLCIMCNDEPRHIGYGDYKGWCRSCKEIDTYIADWSEKCWEESLKPIEEQDENVFRGKF